MDSGAKFGKEAVARAHRRPKWVLNYSAQAELGVLRMLRLYWGSNQVRSPSA
jgi:hypothetical protein